MAERSRFGPPIDPRPVLERDRASLLNLLRELRPEDWEQLTAAAPWTVRDVAAHVLGDDVSRLSRHRDGYVGDGPGGSEPLAEFLHRFNEQWVQAARRISPAVLVSLLEATSPQVNALWRDLDLDTTGEPVSWAGPDPAPVWLDCARDVTEYWVHEQQIREATGRPAPGSAATVHTVLDTFLRAIPFTLRRVHRAAGSTLSIVVPGIGTWSWVHGDAGWSWTEPADRGTTVLRVEADTLWRLCVRMIEPAAARVQVTGDHALAAAALEIVSIIR